MTTQAKPAWKLSISTGNAATQAAALKQKNLSYAVGCGRDLPNDGRSLVIVG